MKKNDIRLTAKQLELLTAQELEVYTRHYIKKQTGLKIAHEMYYTQRWVWFTIKAIRNKTSQKE